MDRLKGKIALITGGTSGMGAATAKRFQAEGATVIVTGSNPQTLEAARAELAGIEVVASDAGSAVAAKALVEQVKQKHGRIDVLFVNAGIAKFAPSAAVDEEAYDQQFNINVKGPYFLIKYAAPVMPDGSSIILTSSTAAFNGGALLTVYGATKAALSSLGHTFAAELSPRRIRVNTIVPGPIETPIFGKLGIPQEQMKGMAESMLPRIPLKRFGSPEEIASAALFFATDDSSFTTGGELLVDGGMLHVEPQP